MEGSMNPQRIENTTEFSYFFCSDNLFYIINCSNVSNMKNFGIFDCFQFGITWRILLTSRLFQMFLTIEV